MKQASGSRTGISQTKDMHQIKAMIDLGLGMYECMSWSCPILQNRGDLFHDPAE